MKSWDFKIFVERRTFSKMKIQPDSVETLTRKKLIKEDEKGLQFLCTGFIYINETLFIIFPKGYSIDLMDKVAILNHSSSLVKTLIKYQRENKLVPEEAELLGDGKSSSLSLYTILNIIEDYKRNGLVVNFIQEHERNNFGKTNWKKTILNTNPIFSSGNPIYINTIVTNSKINFNDIVYIAQVYILNEIKVKYSWLLKLIWDNNFMLRLPQIIPSFNTTEIIYKLKKELGTRFIKREVYLIKLMIKYLTHTSSNNTKDIMTTLATPYFYIIWEVICKRVFNDQIKDLGKWIPQPIWTLADTSLNVPSISQIPDILKIENQSLYILDAKYYDVDIGNYPGWSDAVKQLYYAYTINQKIITCEPKLRIYNAFIMPHSQNKELYRYLGRIEVPRAAGLSTIDSFSINITKVMDYYLLNHSLEISAFFKDPAYGKMNL